MAFDDREEQLRQRGFSEEVIQAMLGRQYRAPSPDKFDLGEEPEDVTLPGEDAPERSSMIDSYNQTLQTRETGEDDDIALDDDLGSAQQRRQSILGLAAAVGGANKIAEAIASGYGGRAPSPDLSHLRQMAKLPVQDIKERTKQESDERKATLEEMKLSDEETIRDSTTPVSKFYRALAQKRGIPVTEDMSAKDLEPILKMTKSNATYRHMTVKDEKTGKLKTVMYNTKDPSEKFEVEGVVAKELRAEEELPSKIDARKEGITKTKKQIKKLDLDIQKEEELNDPRLAKVLQLELKKRGIDAEGLTANQMMKLQKQTQAKSRYQRVPMLNEKGEMTVAYVNTADPNDVVQTNIIDVVETRRQKDLKLKEQGEQRRADQFAFKQDEADKDRATKVVDTFNKDKIVQAALQGFVAADKAQEFVNKGGKMAPAVMGRLLARMAGEVGVMTDQDVAAFRGSQMYKDAMARHFTKTMLSGELTETDKAAMTNMIRIMKEIEMKHYKGRANVISGEFAAVNNLPQEQIMVYLQPALDQYISPTQGKQIMKKFHNKKENKTKYIYSDGTEEIVEGIK